jgi:hypothetical protein
MTPAAFKAAKGMVGVYTARRQGAMLRRAVERLAPQELVCDMGYQTGCRGRALGRVLVTGERRWCGMDVRHAARCHRAGG